MIKYPRAATAVFLLSASVFLANRCVQKKGADEFAGPVRMEQFAGSASCAGCHQDISEKHKHTAHFRTSRPAAEEHILGSFAPDSNRYAFNRSVVVAMEKRGTEFYQVEYFRESEKKARRMDIVVGSGAMGQSFLNWRNQHLFQLPITYFAAAHTWSNSPGFPDKVVFNRVITSRCMECHATFMHPLSEPDKEPEAFDRDRMILGVDCEKCHGPAAQHVQFHTKNPAEKKGKFVVNPALLSRQQNLDLCALCHGGRLQKTKPSFHFTAGERLDDYFVVDTTAPDPNHIDVHGNQYGLLRASKCFQASTTLTCTSCHNTHENERGQVALFSQRCLTCHSEEKGHSCPMKKELGTAITKNCVDCHMPLQPSRAIAVFLEDSTRPTAALIRSHYISIYPEEAKRLVALFKEGKVK